MTAASAPHRRKARAKRLTLTFDNGPTPGVTERVLEILDRHGIRATFFVVGNRLLDSAAAELPGQASKAGHWIGNHTLTHTVPLGEQRSPETALREIEEAQSLIGVWPGQEKLFRPFGGGGRIGPHLFGPAVLKHLQNNGYTTVTWNLVPGDWKNPDGWVEDCIAALDGIDWAVVVLHDIAGGCLSRLPEFLTRIEDMGIPIEQAFPDSVVVTRSGHLVTLPDEIVPKGMLG